jgi:hypothetical protein
MTPELIKGIVKTITDGLKDAQMQYDYAEEAMHEGEYDVATLHISEAKKRLDGAKEWYEKAKSMLPSEKHTALEEILICHYKHWYHDIRNDVEAFHKA